MTIGDNLQDTDIYSLQDAVIILGTRLIVSTYAARTE